jgi:hypothetical protein
MGLGRRGLPVPIYRPSDWYLYGGQAGLGVKIWADWMYASCLHCDLHDHQSNFGGRPVGNYRFSHFREATLMVAL